MDLVIKGGHMITPEGVIRADIGIQGGKIVTIGRSFDITGTSTLDAQGRWIFPGGVDVHCHLPWPSRQVLSADNVYSGTRSAVCGGVTTVIDFVIPETGEDLLSAVERKIDETHRGLYADYCAHVCIREVNDTNLSQIPQLVKQGFVSFKVFMAYEGFRLEDKEILRVLSVVKMAGGIVSVHAENGLLADQATARLSGSRQVDVKTFPASRPAYCEDEAVHRILVYAEATGARLHIHHVSTVHGARIIGKARRRNPLISAETCPQYLLFTDDVYAKEGLESTYLVISPPLRKEADQQGLWESLATGDISVVATDHCPYTLAQKRAGISDFTLVPGGIGGVETRWPLLFTEGVSAGRISPERLAAVWAVNPARLFGLSPRKGSLSVGADADMILIDPDHKETISIHRLHTNADHTVYEGWEVSGFPVTTLLRGKVVVKDGEPFSEPNGQMILREPYFLPAI